MLELLFPSNPASKTKRTRQRILKAAVDVFSRKGYHQARVDEIVAKSNTSKGAVYSHFVSKERIFLAIVDEFADALLRQIEDAISQADGGIGRVDAALEVCLDAFSKHRRLTRIFLVQAIGLGKVFEEKRLHVHANFVGLIKSYLDQAVTEGDIPPQDTRVAASAWMGAINECVINWLHTGQPELESTLPELRRFLLRSIGVAEPRLQHPHRPQISLDPSLQLPDNSILSYTLPWPDVSLLGFLQQASEAPRVYWSNADAPVALAGQGAAALICSTGPDRFSNIREQADHLFNTIIPCGHNHPSQIGPRLLGGFGFLPETDDGIWKEFPPAWFVLPTYQLTRYKGYTWLTINQKVNGHSNPQSVAENIRKKCHELESHSFDASEPSGPIHSQFTSGTSHSEWQSQVYAVLEQIQNSKLEKVVLARYSQYKAPVSSLRMLRRLKQRYDACYRFLFEPIRGHSLYGASPELLVEIEDNKLRSVALAGSISRGTSPREDARLEHQLLTSKKDNSEHDLVVQSIRQILEPLVHNLHVPTAPELMRLANIQHLETIIDGRVTEGNDILSILEALHPTPAVAGVPCKKALELISTTESTSRGWYGGPVGWLDGHGNGQFAVALRTAITVGHDTRIYAGAGIVADSRPDLEWEETEWKLRPILGALGISRDNH